MQNSDTKRMVAKTGKALSTANLSTTPGLALMVEQVSPTKVSKGCGVSYDLGRIVTCCTLFFFFASVLSSRRLCTAPACSRLAYYSALTRVRWHGSNNNTTCSTYVYESYEGLGRAEMPRHRHTCSQSIAGSSQTAACRGAAVSPPHSLSHAQSPRHRSCYCPLTWLLDVSHGCAHSRPAGL